MIYEFNQYSPEWWDARCGIPTCSEFNKIVTPAKFELSTQSTGYACELIAQKYDLTYGQQEEYVTAAMRNGTIMEPEARRFYEFETGRDVKQVGFCVSECGRFGGSPDGLVGDDGGLELKHPVASTQVKYLVAGVAPPEYLPQVHGYLLVTKRKWWDLMSYYPGLPPLLVRIVPDDRTVKLAEALEKFWTMLQEMRAKIEGQGDPVATTRPEFVSPF